MTSRGAGRAGLLGPSRSAGRLAAPRAALLAGLIVALAASLLAARADARVLGAGAYSVVPAAETQTPPKITKQPAAKTVTEGESASFESTASGTPAPTVQWEVSTNSGATWSAIEGATSTVLTIASTKPSEDKDQFRAHFTNTAGSVTSNAVTLTVHFAPIVTQQPTSVTVLEGENATFEAHAIGDPAPAEKWEVSTNGGSTWTVVKEATSATLTILAAKTSQSGNEYRASFTNSFASATHKTSSEPATLTVDTAPAVTHNPESTAVDEGNNATFEATASGFPAPTIHWEVSTDGGVEWAPIPGATSNPLVIESATHEQNGDEYRATFENVVGAVTTTAATLTVHSPPKITLEPQNATILAGENATFEAAATGFPTPTVQWEVSTNGSTFTAIEGATSDQYTVTEAQASQNNDEYRATFTNETGKASTRPAILTVATTNYNAVAWGQNLYRQLGNGSNNAEFDVPVQVSGLKFVVSVAAGGRHSLALIANGKVDAWGFNENGQLGNGGTSTSSTPVEVSGLSDAKAIAAGGAYSLALTTSGTVESWGDNESGQLGTGNNEESRVPIAVKGLTGVIAIAAGAEHGLALLSNGTVKAWGSNLNGQLGDGTFKSSSTPVAVKGLSNVVAIAAGEDFSLALLSNGTVRSWGDNAFGQLGNAEVEESSDVPVEVHSISGASAIAAGATHALALVSGGSVMAWGENKYGELGNGTTKTAEVKPVAVTGISGASAIAAGTHDSAAIVNGGTITTWGIDEYGQLGDGKVGAPSSIPVTVVGIGKAASISAGGAHMLAFGEPLPVVTELSPAIGTNAGGTTVTITGANLSGATSVMFGATAAAGFTVNSSTSITATTPAESVGTVDVIVTTPAGTSSPHTADRYTFQGPPIVTKLVPKSSPVAGGVTVVITGTEFAAATAVMFGSTPAAKFTVNSNTTITATAPEVSAAEKTHVLITNTNSTSLPTTKSLFSFTPTVTSVTPNSGPVAGGTPVTVTGTGFIEGAGLTRFLFGKTRATSVVCASTVECTMVSPAHEAGTVNVIAEAHTVKSPVNSPADSFTYS